MNPTATRARTAGWALSLRLEDTARTWLPLVVILAVAVMERHFVIGNADVAWLITASEKILDGQRLYIDVIELNPPASVFLYLPAVAFARAIGVAPEIVVDGQMFVGAVLSLALVSYIARSCRLLDGAPGWTLAAFALAALTILPAQTFGQREHVALIAVLPVIATLAARAKGARPLFWHSFAAGLAAGLVIAIKPHFALAIGFAAAASALERRSWRVMGAVELWTAAAVATVYAISVVVFYRTFITDLMPVLADVYLPVRLPLRKLMISPPMALWAIALLIVSMLRRNAPGERIVPVVLAASAGFAAAYLIQGKGWPYHSLPMVALTMMALSLAITYSRAATSRAAMALVGAPSAASRRGAIIALGILAVSSFAYLDKAVDTRAAIALVGKVAPPHPSIVAITGDPAIGFPLVRAVQGRWISGRWGLWVTANAASRQLAGGLDRKTLDRLAADVAAERQRLIGEIRDGKPDIILIDDRGPRWSDGVDGDRDLSALIAANYRKAGMADDIIVFKRRGS